MMIITRAIICLSFIIAPLMGCSFKHYDCKVDFNAPKNLIEEAKKAGAQELSPDYMALSEKEFLRAIKEQKSRDCERAQGWAKRAAIDAELAKEYSRIETLKKELE